MADSPDGQPVGRLASGSRGRWRGRLTPLARAPGDPVAKVPTADLGEVRGQGTSGVDGLRGRKRSGRSGELGGHVLKRGLRGAESGV